MRFEEVVKALKLAAYGRLKASLMTQQTIVRHWPKT